MATPSTTSHRRRKSGKFKAYLEQDYVPNVWFERDRMNVRLETPSGRVIFDLWDEDVSDAIDSGYLSTPRRPRPSELDWQPHLVSYAKKLGLL
jgi:hypothetical protein